MSTKDELLQEITNLLEEAEITEWVDGSSLKDPVSLAKSILDLMDVPQEYEYGVMSRQAFAAAYNHAHARSMVESDVRYQGWKVVRRTKAGPWEEVES